MTFYLFCLYLYKTTKDINMCIKLITPYSCNGCEFNCTLDAKETKKGKFTPYINSKPVQDAKNHIADTFIGAINNAKKLMQQQCANYQK